MSDLSPTGPSQPTQSQAYTTPGNPSTKNPAESSQTSKTSTQNSNPSNKTIDQRIPQSQNSDKDPREGAWGLGRGIRGAGAGEEKNGETEETVGRHNELDAEQMGPPGEGKVAEAVRNAGVGGEQVDLASDLDR